MNPRNRPRLLLAAVLALAGVGWWWNANGRTKVKRGFFENEAAALEAAIKADDRAGIARVLASGVNVNTRGWHNVTPLMLAVDTLKQQAVAELLARGADPNLKADDGAGVVSLAVANYREAPEIMFQVLRAGGDPNARRPGDDPVIMRFVNDRNCEYIRHMKALGANLDITTRAGDPIITDAALGQDWDVAWCLIELGAKYDYERTSRQPISESLRGTFPAPDSPIYPYKVKVWEHLKAHGIAVPPLNGPD
ncbi:MAG: hypothetical protein Q8M09_04365 [Pseudomonadota bacterium]|nr:hypothetical protein [Pseudomonadota bacterium]MDP1903471.1 hypothetical protein [Pseudomonadota bacterium]